MEEEEKINITFDDGEQKVILTIENDKLNLLFEPEIHKDKKSIAVWYADIFIKAITT